MKKILPFIMLTGMVINLCVAQKTITNQNLIWYTYLQNLKINDRFSIQTDIQERHFITPLKQSQFLIRSTFKTVFKNNVDFGAGLCFFIANTDPTVVYNLETPEIRPYIEFNNKQPFKHVTLSHRYRLESRFFHNINGKDLEKGFSFGNMRFRYQVGLDILLNKVKDEKNSVKLKINEEIMLNFGKKIKYNLFDQNRVTVTLQYAPIKEVAFEISYINWFQQRSSGDKYFNRNILRFGIVNNISIKKKEKTKE